MGGLDSLEMTRDATERYISVQYTTRRAPGGAKNQTRWVAEAQMQFPAIYQTSWSLISRLCCCV